MTGEEANAPVWCETCQHDHIPGIPGVTWQCRDCGWGQWSEADAVAHVDRQPGHHPYRVGHWIPSRIRKARKDGRAEGWVIGVRDGRTSGMLRMEPTNPYDGTLYQHPKRHATPAGAREVCACNPAEVEHGTCLLCGKPFPVGGSV